MSQVMIYTDGSGTAIDSSVSGFAFRMFFDGKVHEHSGAYPITNLNLGGCNGELTALMEAVKWLEAESLLAREIAIFTDSAEIGYFHSTHKLITTNWIRCLSRSVFNDRSLADTTIKMLEAARIVKIKGHTGIVDNMRVDYLARMAVRGNAPIDYDEWIDRTLGQNGLKPPTSVRVFDELIIKDVLPPRIRRQFTKG
jgi:ribonuclease HI